jgi:serine/threonine-protein kinase PpkA
MSVPADQPVPGYRIVRLLGRGGMATVYLAVQESLGREVALKLLAPELAEDPIAAERFIREARTAARLEHRHIVGVHDVGKHESQPYLSMEYMPGDSIAGGAMQPAEALQVVREIALALDHAHQKGVVHRDVKPENILRRNDGSCALADFGIARTTEPGKPLTQEGMTVGTPHYMSPEQVQGLPLDGRSDLYSLGVVLYQLLTGELPFRGTDG